MKAAELGTDAKGDGFEPPPSAMTKANMGDDTGPTAGGPKVLSVDGGESTTADAPVPGGDAESVRYGPDG
jgi:hypothetical protein